MDCALNDVAASVILNTDADHSKSDMAAAAIQSHCESRSNEWSGWTQSEFGLHDWLQKVGQVPRKAYSGPKKDSLCQPLLCHTSEQFWEYTQCLF
jgi:hypothetical protein